MEGEELVLVATPQRLPFDWQRLKQEDAKLLFTAVTLFVTLAALFFCTSSFALLLGLIWSLFSHSRSRLSFFLC
jgi:hypothetical protein